MGSYAGATMLEDNKQIAIRTEEPKQKCRLGTDSNEITGGGGGGGGGGFN